MIEREFIKDRIKNLNISQDIEAAVPKDAGCAGIRIEKTPLGEKIIINTVRPGLVIGRGGATIKTLTATLKTKYKLENPQIEVNELKVPSLCATAVAQKIASELEKFGVARFKSIGYRELQKIMDAGALGAEIRLSGKVPSTRAKSWPFNAGYMKKSGDVAVNLIDKASVQAKLRPGIVGVKVKIMLPDTQLPDKITFKNVPKPEIKAEEIKLKPVEVEVKPTEEKKIEAELLSEKQAEPIKQIGAKLPSATQTGSARKETEKKKKAEEKEIKVEAPKKPKKTKAKKVETAKPEEKKEKQVEVKKEIQAEPKPAEVEDTSERAPRAFSKAEGEKK